MDRGEVVRTEDEPFRNTKRNGLTLDKVFKLLKSGTFMEKMRNFKFLE